MVGREEYRRIFYIIFIDNLYKEVKERDVEDIFRRFGYLDDVYILKKEGRNIRSRGGN